MRVSRFARSTFAPALVALLIAAGFASGRLAHFNWDPSRFVNAGDRYVHLAPSELYVAPNASGYDGQFYYRLARAPFSTAEVGDGIRFDAAPARQQRIGYPLIVWTLHRLGIGPVPWLLIAVNVIAYAGIGLVGAGLARDLGRNPWWGSVIPLYPGFVLSIALDLAEIVAALFVLNAIRLLLRRRYGLAAIAFTAAALTRETTLVVPIGLLVAWLWKRLRREPTQETAVVVFALPIAVIVAWQAFLWASWGTHPMLAAGRQFSAPFASATRQLWRWVEGHSNEDLFQLLEFALVWTLAVLALQTIVRGRVRLVLAAPLVVATLLMTGFPAEIWLSQTNFLRAGVEASMLSMLVLFERDRFDLRPVAAAAALFTGANMAIWIGAGRF